MRWSIPLETMGLGAMLSRKSVVPNPQIPGVWSNAMLGEYNVQAFEKSHFGLNAICLSLIGLASEMEILY